MTFDDYLRCAGVWDILELWVAEAAADTRQPPCMDVRIVARATTLLATRQALALGFGEGVIPPRNVQ